MKTLVAALFLFCGACCFGQPMTLSDPVFGGQMVSQSTIQGLVDWWKFDEGAGTNALDSSGFNHTAYFTNSPVWTNGLFGNAISFDGVSAWANSTTTIKGQEAYTICFWIKNLDATGALKGFLGAQGSDGALAAIFYLSSGGTDNGFILKTTFSASSNAVSPSVAVVTTNWNHVCLVVNTNGGGTAGNSVNNILYVNGTNNTKVVATGLGSWLSSSGQVTLGRGVNASFYANCIMDEVKIFNRALASNEVWIVSRPP